MQINDKICGFTITDIKAVEELHGEAYYLTHDRTGARLLWLKRDDENKTFSIAFRTIPDDHTGVFHILEHSVLNGSQKYPVKEPFVDLLKGSLNTFLNAMTFADKTVYPVSSRNNQDFINLTRVYLDAVFNPLAVKQPYTFYQEGWHYVLNDESDDLSIKGVVYNEMQGSFASAENYCSELISQSLFPDTGYGQCSGGDPDHIPELTWEKFCAEHARHYHPSNSYIFLDGDLNLEEMLSIIDGEYLCKYERNSDVIPLQHQKPVVAPLVEKEFELPANFPTEKKAIIGFGYVVSSYDDLAKTIAFNLISNHLAGNNQAPLIKAILQLELAEDVDVYVDDSIMQPYLTIMIKNTDLDKYEQIKTVIESTLESLVKNGLDHKEILAAINKLEFRDKERDYGFAPAGILYDINALSSWLYGGDPVEGVAHSYIYDELRKKLSEGYFEQLIQDELLNSKHCCTVLMKPSTTLGQRKAEAMVEKMAALKASFSKEEIARLIELNHNLNEIQMSEDTPEAAATIPLLKLSDIFDKPQQIVCSSEKYNDTTIIRHNLNTNGINYLRLYFDVRDLNEKDLSRLALLCRLLTDLDTEKYDALQLNQLIQANFGKLSFAPAFFQLANSAGCERKLVMESSFLTQYSLQAMEIIKEVMFHTLFDNRKSIADIIAQGVTRLQMGFVTAGHTMGLSRVTASETIIGLANECTSGYSLYQYLKNIDLDEEIPELKKLYEKVFARERVIASINQQCDQQLLANILNSIPEKGQKIEDADLKPLGVRREAIVISGAVGYAEIGGNILEKVRPLTGHMLVAGKILSLDFLWNEVRVKGGAYGSGFSLRNGGQIVCYSYRDPSPIKSLETYRLATEHLREFCKSDQPLIKYIIGTIGDFEPLLTNTTRISAGDSMFINGQTYDQRCQIKAQILATTKQDLLNLCDIIDEVLNKNNYCVVAPKNVIDENRELFDNIIEL